MTLKTSLTLLNSQNYKLLTRHPFPLLTFHLKNKATKRISFPFKIVDEGAFRKLFITSSRHKFLSFLKEVAKEEEKRKSLPKKLISLY
jgi:hypothetical protein